MTWKISLTVVLFTLFCYSARAASIPTSIDSETCTELCSSCDGVAKFEDGYCECRIAANGTECLGRMKREAREYGLDVISCDTNTVDDETRATRCALGHKHNYGKKDMEQVAKYFMQDGPMTGSVFVAPPYTNTPSFGDSLVGKSSGCGSLSQGIITQPAETMPNVGAPLITQPTEFMPVDPLPSGASTLGSSAPALGPSGPALGSTPLQPFGLQEIAPQFLSMLGEMLTKPILGLPQAIQTVSEVPGVSDLVGAPAKMLNSFADQMAEKNAVAKQNLDNFREVVGKAKDDVMVGLSNYKEAKKAVLENALKKKRPSYSLSNPQPMISWLNPTVGSPAPTQFVGSSTPMQFVGAPTPTQFIGSPAPMQFVSAPTPMQFVSAPTTGSHMVGSPMRFVSAPATGSQMVGSPMQFMPTTHLLSAASLMPTQLVSAASPSQIVGAANPGSSSDCDGQMVGSPSPSSGSQMIGSPMFSSMPVIHSLGTIPLSSIVGQMSPTYFVSSPMTYVSSASPAMQPNNNLEEHMVGDSEPSLEEIPLSSPPQKKICKKSTKEGQFMMKYARDVKAGEEDKKEEIADEIQEATTTTTTEVPMIERTTTQKPKADKSVIGKIKPVKKTLLKKL